MTNTLEQKIVAAVVDWATSTYNSREIIIGQVTLDDGDESGSDDLTAEESEAERYLVDYAVRSLGRWMVAEVWVNLDDILGLNDLGEGLPLENSDWPWTIDEIP